VTRSEYSVLWSDLGRHALAWGAAVCEPPRLGGGPLVQSSPACECAGPRPCFTTATFATNTFSSPCRPLRPVLIVLRPPRTTGSGSPGFCRRRTCRTRPRPRPPLQPAGRLRLPLPPPQTHPTPTLDTAQTTARSPSTLESELKRSPRCLSPVLGRLVRTRRTMSLTSSPPRLPCTR
jgi:hypothetical protein